MRSPVSLRFLLLLLHLFSLHTSAGAGAAAPVTVLYIPPGCGADVGDTAAGQLGLQLALEEFGTPQNLIQLKSTQLQDGGRTQIQNWVLSRKPFVLLGGGCPVTKDAASPPYLPDIVPQVIFDRVAVRTTSRMTCFVRPPAPEGLQKLVESFRGSDKTLPIFGVIYTNSSYSVKSRASLRSMISASIELQSGRGDLRRAMDQSRLRYFLIASTDFGDIRRILCSEWAQDLQEGRFLLAAAVSRQQYRLLDSGNGQDGCTPLKRDNAAVRLVVYDDPSAVAQTFATKYRARIGGNDEEVVSSVYEATKILLKALNTSSSLENMFSELPPRPVMTSRLVETGGLKPASDLVRFELVQHTVPLWLFIVFLALVLVSSVMVFGIIVWNVRHATEKIVKMTSPHMNIVMCCGAILVLISIPLDGLSAVGLSADVVAILKSLNLCLLPMGFTLIYGTLALKLWRVFAIFSNIGVKVRHTKDEVLVVAVLLLLLLDMLVFTPVVVLDRITCEYTFREEEFLISEGSGTVRQHRFLACGNTFWPLWTVVAFLLKLPLGLTAVYFGWRIRHVTLPSLREENRVLLVFLSSLGLTLVVLPALSVRGAVQPAVLYALQSTTLLTVVAANLLLHFLPKIRLLRKSYDDDRMKFAESYRATQDSMAADAEKESGCFLRLCGMCAKSDSSITDEEHSDNPKMTAEQLLHDEIHSLKRTVQEKEQSIRELTDRLFYGFDKYRPESCSQGISRSTTPMSITQPPAMISNATSCTSLGVPRLTSAPPPVPPRSASSFSASPPPPSQLAEQSPCSSASSGRGSCNIVIAQYHRENCHGYI